MKASVGLLEKEILPMSSESPVALARLHPTFDYISYGWILKPISYLPPTRRDSFFLNPNRVSLRVQ